MAPGSGPTARGLGEIVVELSSVSAARAAVVTVEASNEELGPFLVDRRE
jgi:hypothetical protein